MTFHQFIITQITAAEVIIDKVNKVNISIDFKTTNEKRKQKHF